MIVIVTQEIANNKKQRISNVRANKKQYSQQECKQQGDTEPTRREPTRR